MMNAAYNVILVIASDRFQQIEYADSKKVIENAGIKVTTASDKPGGAIAKDKSTALVDIVLDDIDMANYDGLFFIGGSGALQCLDIPQSYSLISQARRLYKAYGAICIATRILAKAGALKGIHCTGWNGDNALSTILQGYGAIFDDKSMVTDQLVVTARGPKEAMLFGEGIVRVITEKAFGYRPNHS